MSEKAGVSVALDEARRYDWKNEECPMASIPPTAVPRFAAVLSIGA